MTSSSFIIDCCNRIAVFGMRAVCAEACSEEPNYWARNIREQLAHLKEYGHA